MMATGAAKVRYLLSENGRMLSQIGALLLLVGFIGVAVTMVFPPTMAVTEVTDRSLVETGTTTTATVENDHAMYQAGEELTNEPVYLRGVSPSVTVTATTRAPPDDVVVDQQVSILYTASSTEDGVFRRQKHAITSTSGTIEGNAATVDSVATVQSADLADTLREMRAEIGDAGSVNAYLHVETTYSSDDYEGSLEDRAELTVSPDSYRVPVLSVSKEHRTTASYAAPVSDKVFQTTSPVAGSVIVPHMTLLFLVLSVIGGVVLGAARYGRREFDADRERDRIHRLRYDEWISGGDLPTAFSKHLEVIPMDSLEGLVDIAIDSETRVIHDSQQGRYAVFTDAAVFVFRPDTTAGFLFNREVQDTDK